MKTKYWIMLIAGLLVICLGLSLFLLHHEDAGYVKVIFDGKLLHKLPLSQDTQITVTTDRGTNVITVKDGKVAVTEASCPDHYCVDRGFCSGGVHIVCLPNRMVLEFEGKTNIDA